LVALWNAESKYCKASPRLYTRGNVILSCLEECGIRKRKSRIPRKCICGKLLRFCLDDERVWTTLWRAEQAIQVLVMALRWLSTRYYPLAILQTWFLETIGVVACRSEALSSAPSTWYLQLCPGETL